MTEWIRHCRANRPEETFKHMEDFIGIVYSGDYEEVKIMTLTICDGTIMKAVEFDPLEEEYDHLLFYMPIPKMPDGIDLMVEEIEQEQEAH